MNRNAILFWLSFAGIMVPIRFAVVATVGEDIWISLALISSVTATIIFLSRRGRLGWFGRQFMIQFGRLHQSKKRNIVLAWSICMISMAVFNILLIHEGSTTYGYIKASVLDEIEELGLDITNVETPDDYVPTEDPNELMISLAVASSIVNDIFGGWVLFSWYVILVGEMEILAILALTKRFVLTAQN